MKSRPLPTAFITRARNLSPMCLEQAMHVFCELETLLNETALEASRQQMALCGAIAHYASSPPIGHCSERLDSEWRNAALHMLQYNMRKIQSQMEVIRKWFTDSIDEVYMLDRP